MDLLSVPIRCSGRGGVLQRLSPDQSAPSRIDDKVPPHRAEMDKHSRLRLFFRRRPHHRPRANSIRPHILPRPNPQMAIRKNKLPPRTNPIPRPRKHIILHNSSSTRLTSARQHPIAPDFPDEVLQKYVLAERWGKKPCIRRQFPIKPHRKRHFLPVQGDFDKIIDIERTELCSFERLNGNVS